MAFLRTTLVGLSMKRDLVAVKRNIVMSFATTINVCADIYDIRAHVTTNDVVVETA